MQNGFAAEWRRCGMATLLQCCDAAEWRRCRMATLLQCCDAAEWRRCCRVPHPICHLNNLRSTEPSTRLLRPGGQPLSGWPPISRAPLARLTAPQRPPRIHGTQSAHDVPPPPSSTRTRSQPILTHSHHSRHLGSAFLLLATLPFLLLAPAASTKTMHDLGGVEGTSRCSRSFARAVQRCHSLATIGKASLAARPSPSPRADWRGPGETGLWGR